MPFIRVSYYENQYDHKKLGQISRIIGSELVEYFNVPEDDVFQVFHSHKEGEFYYSPSYLGVERSDGLLYIQITLKSGRTTSQKKGFYSALAEQLSNELPMRNEDVFVVLVDNEFEDWSFGNGEAQMLKMSRIGGVL
ncbi:tautomerase family protein [Paenibacillus sp. Soil750]|uniref:tautomerase family protein n=1 Tax=Paenibacillus sp. Soil750 TaxID=1736398 RepID=UPI0006F83552|nr:tautomerase family protein [Paenibacillus sp. Soil750]KRE70716.1 tautomerase [Paenibacillus sp. Soil750]